MGKQVLSLILIYFHIIAAASFCYGGEQLPRPTVLFDEGHGQKFFVHDLEALGLSRFAGIFAAHGFKVATNPGLLDHQILENADILVISGPFAPYSPDEISAIQKFLSDGGHL